MIRIPLSIQYYYDNDAKLYRQVNSHRTLTIAEYEALEDSLMKSDLIAGWTLIIGIVSLIGVMIYEVCK